MGDNIILCISLKQCDTQTHPDATNKYIFILDENSTILGALCSSGVCEQAQKPALYMDAYTYTNTARQWQHLRTLSVDIKKNSKGKSKSLQMDYLLSGDILGSFVLNDAFFMKLVKHAFFMKLVKHTYQMK